MVGREVDSPGENGRVSNSVYLDHAATTPVLPEAVEAFTREVTQLGNPSSLHSRGRSARASLETAREQVAAALNAEPAEVIFTSGGCESDSLAVVGSALAARSAQASRPRVLISAVEHPAVLEAAQVLSDRHGFEVTRLPVDSTGVLDLSALEAELTGASEEVALVSVMWANNETGAIQPIAQVVEQARRSGGAAIAVHSDAVQAVGHLPIDFAGSDLDALSLSGHKFGAPIGIGALVAQRTLPLAPTVFGGGQERGIRSGTVPVALAVSLAAALEVSVARLESERLRLTALREELAARILAEIPQARRNGPGGEGVLPGHLHVTIPGVDVDALLFGLDSWGVAASAGSACAAGVTQPSGVLIAMGDSEDLARSVLRLTLGHTSTQADVDRLIAVLPDVVERARAAGAVAARRR